MLGTDAFGGRNELIRLHTHDQVLPQRGLPFGHQSSALQPDRGSADGGAIIAVMAPIVAPQKCLICSSNLETAVLAPGVQGWAPWRLGPDAPEPGNDYYF